MIASRVPMTCARGRPKDDLRRWQLCRPQKKRRSLRQLLPDFDGYLLAITMDSSWSTLCPSVCPPTALARRRANTTLKSHGLSVFLLTRFLQSRVARVTGVRTSSCGRRRSCASRPQNQAEEHDGEKDVLFTTAGRKIMRFNFQVCNVRFPIVSVYRMT